MVDVCTLLLGDIFVDDNVRAPWVFWFVMGCMISSRVSCDLGMEILSLIGISMCLASEPLRWLFGVVVVLFLPDCSLGWFPESSVWLCFTGGVVFFVLELGGLLELVT